MKTDKIHVRPTKLVITVPEQVKQEPQLLPANPAHVKTQTLNIAEKTTRKWKSRKNRPKCDQHTQL